MMCWLDINKQAKTYSLQGRKSSVVASWQVLWVFEQDSCIKLKWGGGN